LQSCDETAHTVGEALPNAPGNGHQRRQESPPGIAPLCWTGASRDLPVARHRSEELADRPEASPLPAGRTQRPAPVATALTSRTARESARPNRCMGATAPANADPVLSVLSPGRSLGRTRSCGTRRLRSCRESPAGPARSGTWSPAVPGPFGHSQEGPVAASPDPAIHASNIWRRTSALSAPALGW